MSFVCKLVNSIGNVRAFRRDLGQRHGQQGVCIKVVSVRWDLIVFLFMHFVIGSHVENFGIVLSLFSNSKGKLEIDSSYGEN